MKSERIWTVLSVIVLVLQAVAEALTMTIILQLDMLPFKYVVALVALLVLPLLLVALLFFVRVNGKVTLARRIIACVLALVIVFLCGMASKAASELKGTVNSVSGGLDYAGSRNMYVLVRADDPADTLKDAAGYTFAAIEKHDAVRTEKFAALVGNEIGGTPQLAGYPQASALADALFAKKADALIMSGASIALLIENEAYQTFLDQVKILYSATYETLDGKDTSKEEPVTPVDPEKNVTNTPFVVYVSGSDTRSSMLDVSRSDVNILMVVNPETKQVLLLNTPRDYYVGNPVGDGALDKLTHCGLYGVDCSMETLGSLYNVDIEYYGQINFTGFETLIDTIGGITVYSDQSFKAHDTYIQKGENKLTGSQALDFARERYHVNGGDNGRGKNQMKVITAVIDKMTSDPTIIAKYSAIMSDLEGMFSTNMQSTEISMLVKMQLNDLAKWNVQSFAVTGTGGSEVTYSAPGEKLYVMYPNQESVDYASSLIQKVMAGEKLTAEDMKLPE